MAKGEYERLAKLAKVDIPLPDKHIQNCQHFKNGVWFGYKLAMAEDWWNAYEKSK